MGWEDLDLDDGICQIRRAVKQLSGRLIVRDVKLHHSEPSCSMRGHRWALRGGEYGDPVASGWSRRRGVRVLDVVGVPVLPPPRVASIASRVRAGLAVVHRSLAPPPLRVLEALFGLLDYAALVTLCVLDVPDGLQEPMTIDALARRIRVDADFLDRLVRYSVARGWLRLDRRGRVAPTRTSRFLRRDHVGGWRSWVDLMSGSEVVAATHSLAGAARTGDDPFATANGAPFFDWMTEHPRRGAIFDAAMAAGGRMHGLALAAAIDWSQTQTVCDVGGGNGALLEALLGVRPHLRGVLIDLPPVVARVTPQMRRRIDAVPGDAFEAVPADIDTYLVVNVVHDWSDHDAVRLLARIAVDAAPTSRVIVVEGVRRARPIDDVAHRTDLLMLLLAPGGRERRTEEISSLAHAAGLVPHRVIPLATGDVAHVLRRADDQETSCPRAP